MIAIAALLVMNVLILVVLMQVGQTLASFFVPRLELAKGVSGTPQKMQAIYSLWGLGAIWKSREIIWNNIWIIVLGLQTLMSVIFLGPIFTTDWVNNEKLLIPLVFLIIQIIVALKTHAKSGEKHPNVRRRTYAAIVGAIGLCVTLFGTQPHQYVEGWLVAGYIVKWLLLLFLYITLSPLMTFSKSSNVPTIVSRISEAVWALGMAMIFWPPQTGDMLLSCVEQWAKAQGILFLYDISKTMFSKIKVEFFETIIMGLVLPLIFIASVIIALGL